MGSGIDPPTRPRRGKSLEATVRELLQQEALRPKQERAAKWRRLRDELYKKYGTLSDSAALIREERAERENR